MIRDQIFIPITFDLPFVVGNMNIYLFPGEPLTLLDTGPKTEPARHAIEKTFEEHGLRIEQIKRIVISHGHVDHFGLARELAEKSGAEIFIHPCDAPKVQRGYHFYGELSPFLREAGVPEEHLGELEGWCTFADSIKEPLENVQLLEDEAAIPFETFSLRVIHCPGHAQGHIALYHEASGDLFGGDHILRNITPNPAMERSCKEPEKRNQALVQYLASVKKIEQLHVKRILGAHGPAVENPQERIEQIYRHHLRRKEKLLGLLNGKGATAYELGKKLFGTAKEADIFLTVSEVFAHLDLLLEENRARAEKNNGVFRYFAA